MTCGTMCFGPFGYALRSERSENHATGQLGGALGGQSRLRQNPPGVEVHRQSERGLERPPLGASHRKAAGQRRNEPFDVGGPKASHRLFESRHDGKVTEDFSQHAFFEETTRTLFCGDLFTQPGAEHPPVVESDILGPSEAMRSQMDYFARAKNTGDLLAKLAATEPTLLACMHGSAWRGDGAALLGELAQTLA